jgi:predicted peptidase
MRIRSIILGVLTCCVGCCQPDFTTVDIRINNKPAVIFLPANYDPSVRYPFVIGLHGAGQTSRTYTSAGKMIPQACRDQSIAAGYIFCAITTDENTFGDSKPAIENVKALYDHMIEHYRVFDRCVFWTISAGGSLGHNVTNTYPEINVGAIGIFPVYDFGKVIGVDAPPESSPANPKNFVHKLGNREYWIVHGTQDPVVLYSSAETLKKDVEPYGGEVHIHSIEGGIHQQAPAYTTGASQAFFAQALNSFRNRLAVAGKHP